MAISASHEGACAPAFASSSSMWTRSDSCRCLPLHPFELTPTKGLTWESIWSFSQVLGERDRSRSPVVHYLAMQFDSPSGEPPKHRGQRGCDSLCVPTVPVAVLFRSSRWFTTPTRQQLSTLFSLHPSLPTLHRGNPSIHPSIHLSIHPSGDGGGGGIATVSHALQATYLPLCLLHKGHPVPSIPCPHCKLSSWFGSTFSKLGWLEWTVMIASRYSQWTNRSSDVWEPGHG